MGKKLLTLLYILLSLGLTAPSVAGAATPHDEGYVRVGVPDLPQAVTFFRNVLDCGLMAPESTADSAAPVSVLLSCGEDSVVELFAEPDSSPSPASNETAQPLLFVSDNVLQAGKWLRQQGVIVGGAPHRLTSGPLAGRMVLDFTAPWGLRLQLLDREAGGLDGGTVATTDAPYDGS